MKKKLFVIAALVVVLAILTTGTLAYYSAKAVAHNVITTDSVGITVVEKQLVENEDGEKELVDYPDGEISVMPGSTVSKIVTIRNDQAESFIRACVEIVVMKEGKTPQVLTIDEASDYLSIDLNTDHWKTKENDSKWLYYMDSAEKHSVETGKGTAPLFYEVHFRGDAMDNTFQNSTIEIHIAGQAVQAANNGTDVLQAAGWPQD